MKIDVLTLFPEMFDTFIQTSIIGRAVNKKNLIEINAINIRDFSKDIHKKTDDAPYGGGSGLVMTFQPIYDAYLHAAGFDEDSQNEERAANKPHVVYLSPQGAVLTHKKCEELSGIQHLILLCGHYEGVDERIIETIVDEEISIGDYVLTGGELPAMVLIDSVARLIPGVISQGSAVVESFTQGLLEYPHYTRPEIVNGKAVPEILLSGHHKNIEKWREEQSLIRTQRKRPDILNLD